MHDYDGVNETDPARSADRRRERRKVLVQPDRNGYMYVIDRATGEVLSADPYGHITSSRGVDLKTGRLREAPDKIPTLGKVVRGICPASPGAKDWQPSALSPRTRLLYIPHQNLCQDQEATEANYIAGTPYLGATVKMYPGPGGHRGEFTAWDPVARKAVWTIREKFPVWSGAVATGGDLVFYGTMEGWFKAVDARSGKVLWRFKTGSGIIGQPISYRGPDGKQYVAVLSGVGGWAGAVVAGGLDAARLQRGPRLRQRDEGSAGRDHQGRHALCLRAAVARVSSSCAGLALPGCERESAPVPRKPGAARGGRGAPQRAAAGIPDGGRIPRQSVRATRLFRLRRQGPVPAVQLLGLSCPGRRRHRSAADGHGMDLRERAGERLPDHHPGPTQRDAGVRRQGAGRPGLAAGGLCPIHERSPGQGCGTGAHRRHAGPLAGAIHREGASERCPAIVRRRRRRCRHPDSPS